MLFSSISLRVVELEQVSNMEGKTVMVRRGNVVLSVPEIDAENYLAKGYDILGLNGNVVKESVPNDVPTLQAKLKDALEENARLKAEIDKLKTQKKSKSSK